MFSKVLSLVVVTFFINDSLQCFTECPTFWTYFDSNCYRYFGSPFLSWRDAERFCINEGGHLVSIHSQKEQEFVEEYWFSSRDYVPNLAYYSLVRKPFSFLYIGLQGKGHEGSYEWTDGSPLDYEHWLPGEPSGGHEKGVMLWDRHNNKNRGRWNDVVPVTPRLYGPFMCKLSPPRRK